MIGVVSVLGWAAVILYVALVYGRALTVDGPNLTSEFAGLFSGSALLMGFIVLASPNGTTATAFAIVATLAAAMLVRLTWKARHV